MVEVRVLHHQPVLGVVVNPDVGEAVGPAIFRQVYAVGAVVCRYVGEGGPVGSGNNQAVSAAVVYEVVCERAVERGPRSHAPYDIAIGDVIPYGGIAGEGYGYSVLAIVVGDIVRHVQELRVGYVPSDCDSRAGGVAGGVVQYLAHVGGAHPYAVAVGAVGGVVPYQERHAGF